MSYTVIIPARYQASRFPGKMLAPLAGKTVLEHTWLQAKKSTAAEVIVAVDDVRVEQVAKDFGAQTCMTSSDLQSGTDRVFQAAVKMGCEGIIVNLQGDEPLFASDDINRLAQTLIDHEDYSMASMMHPFTEEQDIENFNMVKVVTDNDNRALYFSRCAIPFCRKPGKHFRHLGIYAYSMNFLEDFVNWPVSDLERSEQLEQLRALSNGANILMTEATHQGYRGIDSPEDLEVVAALLEKNTPN